MDESTGNFQHLNDDANLSFRPVKKRRPEGSRPVRRDDGEKQAAVVISAQSSRFRCQSSQALLDQTSECHNTPLNNRNSHHSSSESPGTALSQEKQDLGVDRTMQDSPNGNDQTTQPTQTHVIMSRLPRDLVREIDLPAGDSALSVSIGQEQRRRKRLTDEGDHQGHRGNGIPTSNPQVSGRNISSRPSTDEHSFNGQDTFIGRRYDNDREEYLRHAVSSYLFTPFSRAISNNHLPILHRQRRRPIATNSNPRSESFFPSNLSSGYEARPAQLSVGPPPAVHGSGPSVPLYPTATNHQNPFIYSHSAGSRVNRESLHQNYQDLEVERSGLATASPGYSRSLNSYRSDAQQLWTSQGFCRGIPSQSTLAEYSSRLRHSQEHQCCDGRLRHELNRRLHRDQPQIFGSSLVHSSAASIPAQSQSNSVGQSPTNRRAQVANDEILASLTSPGRLTQGSLNRGRFCTLSHLGALVAYNDNNRDNIERDTSFQFQNICARRVVGPPPCVEGPLPPCSERFLLSLKTEEQEGSSDLYSFVRSELIEVFRASGEDVAARIHNNRIVYRQIGMRCRFCAHLPRDERTRRAAAFPSSIIKIHQSLLGMVREHFSHCRSMPSSIKSSYNALKAQKKTPAEDSRKHCAEAASRLGLVDADNGIMHITDSQSCLQSPRAMTTSARTLESERELLVEKEDRALVPDYLYYLMSQSQRISLTATEFQKKLQRNTTIGMAGFGCLHCSHTNMTGDNRFFPTKRRLLPSEANRLYIHLQECRFCPHEVKLCLSILKSSAEDQKTSPTEEENIKAYFSRIWTRLHGHLPVGVPAECLDRSKRCDLDE